MRETRHLANLAREKSLSRGRLRRSLPFVGVPWEERCVAPIRGDHAQCARRRTVGVLCTQHSKIARSSETHTSEEETNGHL